MCKIVRALYAMYKHTSTKLLDEPRNKVSEWLKSFDTVITDCDGVLWLSTEPLPNSAQVLNELKASGKAVYFCTNNSTKTRKELYEKGRDHGINISVDYVISTAHSTANYLKEKNFDKRVYVVGSSGITQELDLVGIDHTTVGQDVLQEPLGKYLADGIRLEKDIGAVVVGFDEHFSFPKIVKAASYLSDPNILFIATNTDERMPLKHAVIPGSGTFVRAIQTASERDPFIIGKPNPNICAHLIREKKIVPHRTLMIGDRCNTDILLGFNCGFQTLLVGSGIHTLKDVEPWKNSKSPELKKLVPDVYLPKLGDLLPFLNVKY